jgi:RNA binding exosome subunit
MLKMQEKSLILRLTKQTRIFGNGKVELTNSGDVIIGQVALKPKFELGNSVKLIVKRKR